MIMNKTITLFGFLILIIINGFTQIETYNWPVDDADIISDQYTVKVRQLAADGQHGVWQDITVLNVKTRPDVTHPIAGGQCSACNILGDRVTSFAPFGFEGPIEVEVTKAYGTTAPRVEITPKAYLINPHYFNGSVVRFTMKEWGYVSVNFISDDNKDDDGKGGKHIKYGLMLFADKLESKSSYEIPNIDDPGVVVWDNNVDIETLRSADILYFPPGNHKMKEHKDNEQEFLTIVEDMENAPLYHGQLRLNKSQKIYLAGGAYVQGCFNSKGFDDIWLYGRGIISGRDHLFHEILIPKFDDNGNWVQETATKEAFVDLIGSDNILMEGITIIEAIHHTCPSGKNGFIKNIKLFGFNYNNDGVRPGDNTIIDGVFMKTMDDYDYARGIQDFKNSIIWPMFNGSVGMISWSALGGSGWNFHDNNIINSESKNSYSNNDGIIGSQADFGIQTNNIELKNIYIDHPITNLVDALIKDEGSSTNTNSYLKDFRFINIKSDFAFKTTGGVTQKNRLLGCKRGENIAWVEDFVFTNMVVEGNLVTWNNYKNYFDIDLTGSNGSNTDNSKYARNITFNTEGALHNITVTSNDGGTFYPKGNAGVIVCPDKTDQGITILPNNGFKIKEVIVDGKNLGRKQNIFFKTVTKNTTLNIVFEAAENDYYNLSIDTSIFYRDAVNPTGDIKGIEYLKYYGSWTEMPDFTIERAKDTAYVDSIHANIDDGTHDFAAVFHGYINVPDTAEYTFTIKANNPCKFTLSNDFTLELTSQNTMNEEAASSIKLKAGKHAFRIEYLQKTDVLGLELYWETSQLEKTQIPASAYTTIPLPREFIPFPNATNLAAFVKSSSELTLVWEEDIPNEDGFIIERALAGTDNYITAGTTGYNNTTFTDTGLEAFTLYNYRIKTQFGNDISQASDSIFGRTQVSSTLLLPNKWESITFADTLVAMASKTTFERDTFYMDAGDGDFWTDIDRGQFTYMPYTGDCEIITKINDFTHAQSYTMAGVMIRDSLYHGSKFASSFMISDPGPVMRDRIETDGQVNQNPKPMTGEQAPYWVKLTRMGDEFIAYSGADTNNWKETRRINIPMNEEIYVGMATTSHNHLAPASFTFSDVIVRTPVKPASTYTITASASDGGFISPSGTVTVNENGEQTFAITANDGYEILDVLVDNISKGDVSSFTFENITANHTINASFKKIISIYENQLVGLKIFPNPANHVLNINVNEGVEGSISIYNITGSLVISQNINSENTQVNLQQLESGVYEVVFTNNNSILVNKLIVK